MVTRQEKFYNEVYAGARQAGLSDSRARLAAAQASLETGYGQSMPGGNMFGIKAGSSWTGPTQNVSTWEDIGGRVNIVDKFRSYVNPFDSLTDWVGLTDRRYPAAAAATTFTEAVDGLNAGKQGGYATDRQYSSKLKSIDEKLSKAAQQNYGLMGKEIPTPSAAPRGVMDALGSTPEEVADFTDRGLRSASFTSATPMEVNRGGILSEPSTFDVERFGPAPSTMNFDAGRFGGTSPNMSYSDLVSSAKATRPETAQTAQATQFDSGRFAEPVTQAQGMDELRSGLLSSNAQLAGGVLSAKPSTASLADQYKQYGMGQAAMQQALAPTVAAQNLAADVADYRALNGLPAVQPTYVDPTVSVASPTVATTTSAPSQAAPAQSILSPEPQYSGGFGPSMTPAEADRMMKSLDRQKMFGGILGGLAGGMLLGPIGALAGGYFGRQTAAKNYYPTAPQPAANSVSVGNGRDSLSSYGRDVYSGSKQFENAVNSGTGGLW